MSREVTVLSEGVNYYVEQCAVGVILLIRCVSSVGGG